MMKLYTFLIIAAIFAIVSYLTVFDAQRAYDMQTVFLVVPQNQIIASHSMQVMENMVYIIERSLPDGAYIAHKKDTGILTLSVSHSTPSETRTLHKESINMISDNVKKYYGMVDDIIMYVVSTDTVPRMNVFVAYMPYALMIIIAIGAIAGVFAIFSLIDAMRYPAQYNIARTMDGRKIFEKFHTPYAEPIDAKQNDVENRIIAQKANEIDDNDHRKADNDNEYIKTKNENVELIHTERDHSMSAKKNILIATNEFKIDHAGTPEGLVSIPGNLPVVDVESLGFPLSHDAQDRVDEGNIAEATEEELKERLNQLLNGKL